MYKNINDIAILLYSVIYITYEPIGFDCCELCILLYYYTLVCIYNDLP